MAPAYSATPWKSMWRDVSVTDPGDSRSQRPDEHHDADRQVHEEHVAPGPVFQNVAADVRPDDRPQRQDATKQAAGLSPTLAIMVGDDAHGRWHQPAAADSLERARPDQEPDRRCQPAEERADREGGHAEQEHPLAAERVAELARQRQHDDLDELIRRDRPANVEQRRIEGRGELRHRDGDDRRVDRTHHHGRDGQDEEDMAGGREGACGMCAWLGGGSGRPPIVVARRAAAHRLVGGHGHSRPQQVKRSFPVFHHSHDSARNRLQHPPVRVMT